MKIRILLVSIASALMVTGLQAATTPPATPDSGATAGLLAVGLLAAVALRRKSVK